DVFFAVNKIFGQISVKKVDTPFVINFFAGHVVGADHVVDRTTRTPHGGGDIVARLHATNIGSHFFHDPKRFVTEHQEVVSRRSVAVERVVDFAIGGIHAHFQNLNQDSFSIRNVAHLGLGQFG